MLVLELSGEGQGRQRLQKMDLGGTALLLEVGVETDGLGVATGVVTGVKTKVELWDVRMEGAMGELGSDEALTTIITGEVTESGVEF